VAPSGSRLAAVVVDGLGHGARAHAGSTAALAELGDRPADNLAGYVSRAHEAMRGTRGGVLGICAIDPGKEELSYVGVGNVTGQVLLGDATTGLLSREGTLGTTLEMPHVRLASYRWGPGATLVLASDGLRGRGNLLSGPGLLSHDPTVIAATIHRDGERGTDDATVLVVRDEREPAA
jgi:hypothetical protein